MQDFDSIQFILGLDVIDHVPKTAEPNRQIILEINGHDISRLEEARQICEKHSYCNIFVRAKAADFYGDDLASLESVDFVITNQECWVGLKKKGAPYQVTVSFFISQLRAAHTLTMDYSKFDDKMSIEWKYNQTYAWATSGILSINQR